MMKRYRFMLLGTAWLAYMAFTIVAYPFCGISVLLPSILLCGFATWLYGYKIGLLTFVLSHPYHVLVMMYNLDSLQGWHIALNPGGTVAKLLAVFFVAMLEHNRKKGLELTANMEKLIRQRNKELKEIAEYMITQSVADRSRMSDTLCNIVAYQQTGLLYHSEALMNFLVYYNAPQADAARKLVQIAKENMEQVKNVTRKLSPQKILKTGIKEALHEMCAFFMETVGTRFSITVGDRYLEIPEKVAQQIYRIAHEVVTNALRHGKATQVDLALEVDDRTGTLIVENNGSLVPESVTQGIGTRLIQQRADIIHATTRLEPSGDGKTRFECIVPLHESPPRQDN